MDDLAAGILVLTVTGEGDREDFAAGALFHQPDGRVLHGHLGAEVAVDPLHRRVLVGRGPLGDEVVDVLRPVLDRRVAAAGAFLDDDLDHRRVEAVGASRSGRCSPST